jgi:2-haloacid dehalogenase
VFGKGGGSAGAGPPLFVSAPENDPVSAPHRSTVIFDLGGVLIDWNPRHLYRKLFPGDEAAMEYFLAHVCNDAWNVQQDAGRPFAEAIVLLKKEHPGKADLIDAYWDRWIEMLAGPIHDTVDILAALRERHVPLYALTNWSAETWSIARPLFPFLDWFDGIVVSGQELMAKPDPRIFRLLLDRFGLRPEAAVYIDDSRRNVEAAAALGLHAIHFAGAQHLADELVGLSLLPAEAVHQK